MLHLIPAPLHRLALRVGSRLMRHWRRIVRPQLVGASVIVQDPDGPILMVRHSYGEEAWLFPGGGCKRGEAPADCARREIREELGCAIESLELIGRLDETISGAPHAAFVFHARLAGPVRPDGREILEARYFPLDALPEPLGPAVVRRIALLQGYSSDS
ncbi:hypothetical protein B2G71_02135 [Novosphingobium sp. PC22D]|uniref:NUDIX hydrolase n=1 Tax=Novosphingobium sp. PC22D TaxID=1962403 RepID=UPI000BF09C7E|nr:NUDIX domain-containing protein [Novosphingobium sp. PC22D]PEQ14415.1 hypothetical protein B2G71_02135 [Novosphingobium sp. PC22D]